MIRSYKIRLLPNEQQEELLWKHVNGARFVWNHGLNLEMERFKNNEQHLSGYDLRKIFTVMKKTDEYKWLSEISGHTISEICLDLEDTYKRFFKKLIRMPKFKKKHKCKNAFPVRKDSFYLKNNCAVIEKIGKVKYQTNYKLPQGINVCKFANPRIKFENNKWILGFGVKCDNQAQKLTDKKMGVDLGVKELAVISFESEKIVYKNINKTKKVNTLKKKLKHLQKINSKKYEVNNKNKVFDKKWHKSKNILKLEAQIRKVHQKLFNIRNNYIHQTTASLTNLLPCKVIMEDLNIIGMMKNKHLSKAISEQCFNEFIRQMQYKCEFKGIEFIQVDRFYPSSKTCSCCGYIKKDLKLTDRIYICDDCGFEIDRDLNAATNLMNYSNI